MRNFLFGAAAVAVVVVFTAIAGGCATLTPSEEERVADLQSIGVDPECEGHRSPSGAAVGNIFFGIGDLTNGQGGLFAVDFLLWPLSIAWAPTIGCGQAHVLNQKETVDYLFNTREGAAHLAAIRAGSIPVDAMSPRRERWEKEKYGWSYRQSLETEDEDWPDP
jgi:hypothetical protein